MLKKSGLNLIFLFSTLFFAVNLSAAESPMTGVWKTIDDKTGKEKSLVEISTDQNGNLKGKIIKLLRGPDEDQNPVCDKCQGDKKDAPVLGMEILWGFTQKHMKNPNTWNSGKILDPKNGVTYGCNLALSESGNELQVRGFVGFALLGRTQKWIRVNQ